MNPILLACHNAAQPTSYIRITGSQRLEIEPSVRGMTIKSVRGGHSFTAWADSVEIVPEIPSEATAAIWNHSNP